MRRHLVALLALFFTLHSSTAQTPLIAEDQMDSFMQRELWVIGVAQVLVSDEWSETELEVIKSSIEAWNAVGQKRVKQDYFKLMERRPTRKEAELEATFDYQRDHLDFLEPKSYIFVVKGGTKTSETVPGMTSMGALIQGAHSLGTYSTIEIRPTASMLSTIATHELGHAIGLNHSCNGDENSDPKFPRWVLCKELKGRHEYQSATMYPSVQSGTDRSLPRINDEKRAEWIRTAPPTFRPGLEAGTTPEVQVSIDPDPSDIYPLERLAH